MPNTAPLQEERRLVAALCEALEGRLDRADGLLRESGESTLSAPAIDVLARVAVARGDDDEARRLWQLALERDGDFEPAHAALAALDSPWRAKAMLRAGIIATGGLLIAVLAGFGVRDLVSAPQRQTATVSPAVAAAPVATTSAPVQASWPDLQVAGFEVEQRPGSLTLRPAKPLFGDRCELAATAAADLKSLAGLMQAELHDCTVVIVGQTDPRTVRSDSAFRDNYNLGWQRAVAVADYLRRVHGVESQRITGTSAGLASASATAGGPAEQSNAERTVAFRFERLR